MRNYDLEISEMINFGAVEINKPNIDDFLAYCKRINLWVGCGAATKYGQIFYLP